MDEEEHVVIARERERLVGKNELLRRARRGLVSDLVGFLRAMAPFIVLLAAAATLQLCMR
jgi:hypothetical protein